MQIDNVIIPIQATLLAGDFLEFPSINTIYINPLDTTSSYMLEFYDASGANIVSSATYNIIFNLVMNGINPLGKTKLTCISGSTQIFVI